MKKNYLLIAMMTASALAPLGVVPIQAKAVDVVSSTKSVTQKNFIDVSVNSPYFTIIHEMRNQNIISGYEDGTFKPSEIITRKHAAALVSRAKTLEAVVPFVKFNDVSEQNAYFNDIKKLQQAGIFEADSKGNFNPNKAITRAEMAKVLALAFDLETKSVYDFPDVPSTHVASKYVRAIYSNGITTGDNGMFLPNESLTRVHYAVFMHRALNVDTDFVPQPIPEQTPTIAIADMHFMDVPRPKGYVYKTWESMQEKAFAEIRVRNGHNRVGGFNVWSGLLNEGETLEERLTPNAKTLGISYIEMVKIINWAVETGQVHDGGSFSLYYDFSEGFVKTSNYTAIKY